MGATKSGSEILVNTSTSGVQQAPTITGLTNGGFVVTWIDQGSSSPGLKAQLFDAAGAKVSGEFVVKAGVSSAPVIAALTNGGFVVTWDDGRGQVFDASGAKVGNEFDPSPFYASRPAITGLTNGGFVVTWDDLGTLGDNSASIHAQLFNASGVKVGGEFLVNTTTNETQRYSTVTGLTNGNFVVTWEDYSGTLGDSSGSSIKAQVFNSGGAKVGGEFLVNTTTANDQRVPIVTDLTSGGFVVAWRDSSGFKAQLFNASGAKVGSELSHPHSAYIEDSATVTGLTNGGFVVTWAVVESLAESSNIKAQVYDGSGAKVGGEFVVNTTTANQQLAPSITGLTDGGFAATWTHYNGDSLNPIDVRAQIFAVDFPPVNSLPASATASASGSFVFSTAGNTAVTVSDADGDSLTMTLDVLGGTLTLANTAALISVSGNGTGHVVITGYSPSLNAALDGLTYQAAPGYGGSDRLTVSTSDGALIDTDDVLISALRYGKSGGEIVVNTQLPGVQQAPTITGLTNGGFVVTWIDQGSSSPGIKAQLFDAAGAKVSGEFVVKAGVSSAPVIAALTNGGFVVTWDDGRGQVFDASGAKVGNEFDPSPFYASRPAITGLTNGGFVVTWDDLGTLGDNSASIHAQLFNASGVKVGSEFLVNTTTNDTQRYSTVTALTNGNFVVTWEDYSGTLGDSSGSSIKAQVFNSGGAKVGSEFLVNTTTANDQRVPIVTDLTNGGFVVAWRDQSGFKAQMFNAGGAKVGSELSHSYSAYIEDSVTVTGLTNGGFVVTWAVVESLAESSNIKAQVYDAGGAKVGGEFLVNTTTADQQVRPSITGLTDGGFAVTWQHYNGDSLNPIDIRAQVFGVSAAPLATNLNASEIYTEDAALNLADIVISDLDTVSVTATLTLSNAAAGALSTATSNAVTSTYNAATGVWTASGALADVNALLAGVRFTPAPDFNGNFAVVTSVTDGISTVTGSKAFTGAAVNDAPSGANATKTIDEDSSYAFAAADFGFSDVDGNALAGVKITTLPGAGTLKLSNVAVTAGQVVAAADIPNLVYAPALDGNGANYASFAFQVQDDGGTANGGVNLDPSANIFSFNVTPQNTNQPTDGPDTLIGGPGADSLTGLGGDDVLIGGPAPAGQVNHLDGGPGQDAASYVGASAAVYADLRPGAGYVGGVLTDLFVSIENLTGGSGNDLLVGDDTANVFSGGGGTDQIQGMGGDDRFVGGTAAAGTQNQLFGGAGTDTVDYSAQTADVYVELRAPAGYVKSGGNFVLTDLMNSVENALGGSGNDILVGTDADNNLLVGGAGTDLLFGFGGDDALVGGAAQPGEYNQLFGDTGSDTASYAGTSLAVYADLQIFAGYTNDGSGYTLVDVWNSIENLTGGSGGDVLAGNGAANVITGGGGADILYGRGGADTFVFKTLSDSNLATGYDTIADFLPGARFGGAYSPIDRIDLHALGLNPSQIVISSPAGSGSTALYADADVSTPGYEFAVVLVGEHVLSLDDIIF